MENSFEHDIITLADGTPIRLRPIRPDDAPRLQALITRLSAETIYRRFLGARTTLSDEEAQRLATVDYRTRMAVVATCQAAEGERIVGVARYDSTRTEGQDDGEVAVVVEDRLQGQGVGTALLQSLLKYARSQGLHSFYAEIYWQNDRILRFVEKAGLPYEKHFRDGVWHVRVSFNPDYPAG